MKDAIEYILQRDQEKAGAPTTAKRRATSSVLPAARKSQTRRKRVQSTRDQSTSASRWVFTLYTVCIFSALQVVEELCPKHVLVQVALHLLKAY